MRFRLLLSPTLLLLAAGCVPLGTPITNPDLPANRQSAAAPTTARPLRYYDYEYDPAVRSVQCYVPTSAVTDVLLPPIVPLSQEQPITLEFDLLGNQAPRLTSKLIHCDFNWQPSQLIDNQFLDQLNEQVLTNYAISVNTKVPFYHYAWQMPRVKLSGNYLVVIQNSAGQPLLTRRLLVYENQVVVGLEQGVLAGGVDARYTYQQVNFRISYAAVDLVNPTQEVHAVLRQNFRWDNAHYELRPTFVRDAERVLEYQYFNYENALPGLSEYRYFDTRSLLANGLGVAQRDIRASPTQVALVPEATRNGLAYNAYVDADGQRVFQNREYGNGDVNADYAQVTFTLNAPDPAPGPVFVFGALSDWQLKPEYQLRYDSTRHAYVGQALLKQGYYNYDYAIPGKQGQPADETYFEGSHQETENFYDLLVYYRPPGTRTDLLIAYQSLDLNKR